MDISNITSGVVTGCTTREYGDGKELMNFRLRTSENYPQELEFTMYDGQIKKFKGYINDGAVLNIKFNLKAREYNERIYFTLQPWWMEEVKSEKPTDDENFEEEKSQVDGGLEDEEDVPF
jgi:hypothetical protein